MIIVLQNADFSKNNIGKVDLNVPFIGRTKTILSYYGVTVDEKDVFQKEFNKFVVKLQNEGIFDKLKGLCLPFMANIAQNGNLSYAQINAVNGENFFTSNISGSLKLENGGLKAVAEGVAVCYANGNIMSNNAHFGAYNITEETPIYSEDGTLAPRYIFGRAIPAMYGLCKMQKKHSAPGLLDGSIDWVTGDPRYASASCFICCNITQDVSKLFVNGQKTEKKLEITNVSKTDSARVFQYTGNVYDPENVGNDCYCRAAYSVLTYGEALSDDQTTVLTDAITVLMRAVS